MVFVAKLLDSLNQSLFEFDQSGEIGVEAWGLLDVFENGGKRVGKKDGCCCPHNCAPLSRCGGCIALKSFKFAQCSLQHL